jgi:hypothetical protein
MWYKSIQQACFGGRRWAAQEFVRTANEKD